MVIRFPITKNKQEINQSDLKKALDYIDAYWSKLVRDNKEDHNTHIGLPYKYIVPATDKTAPFRFEEQYYWDSYFIALGLTKPEHQEFAEGMLENIVYLFTRFGMVPNASRMYASSRSQPPLMTSYIFHIYETYNKDHHWLQDHINIAKKEYEQVWMNDAHPQWHRVYKNLSRYYDINALHDLAEAESGWDMTPRFERKCQDYLPIDLNSLLYKYEVDFAKADEILGHKKSAKEWSKKAKERKSVINELMWGKIRGFYFDYNFQKKVLGDVWSLAGYYPMWVGMVDKVQAKRLVDNLAKFSKKGGLSTTTRPFIDTNALFGSVNVQWAYPNGWAPLQLIVIEALQNYGYHEEARKIATKWVLNNLQWFNKHGIFQEKYNVVNIKKLPQQGVYPSQNGFGWTNSVFVKLVKDFNLLEA